MSLRGILGSYITQMETAAAYLLFSAKVNRVSWLHLSSQLNVATSITNNTPTGILSKHSADTATY